MVEMTFEPEMLETLAKMKGKIFKSYEGYFPVSESMILDRVRFNLGGFAVMLEFWYKEVDNWREFFMDPPVSSRAPRSSSASHFPWNLNTCAPFS